VQHTAAATVARFSGTGLAASADASGRVLVWDVATKKTKLQIPSLAGAVNDLSWSPDGKRLFVCGDGRGNRAACFNADTGAALGPLIGLSRAGNALDVSADGLRVATGDDGGAVNVYEGTAPFKHRFCAPDRSGGRAVNCVRFAPSGGTFAVAGKGVLLYTGDGVAPTELAGHAPGSSVFACAWSTDGAQLATAGADKTCRLWDVKSAREICKLDAGTELNDMQVGCAWLGNNTLVSVGLGGDVRVLDARTAKCQMHIIGHQRAITAACAGADETVFTSDYLGHVLRWSRGALR
jgi:WD40 repeat protein